MFPGTAVPLHVFEERYLTLVKEALEHDTPIAIAMLQEGADPLSLRAPVCPVACAGRIVHHETTNDGRYNILVHGLVRVHLRRELPLQNGYRCFKAELFAAPDADLLRAAKPQIARLQSSVLSLRQCIGDRDADLVEVLRVTSDPLELADILSAVLVSAPDRRQELLALEDVRLRFNRVIDAVAEVMVNVGEPLPTGLN